MEAFARALRQIPATIADNAGLDSAGGLWDSLADCEYEVVGSCSRGGYWQDLGVPLVLSVRRLQQDWTAQVRSCVA